MLIDNFIITLVIQVHPSGDNWNEHTSDLFHRQSAFKCLVDCNCDLRRLLDGLTITTPKDSFESFNDLIAHLEKAISDDAILRHVLSKEMDDSDASLLQDILAMVSLHPL